MAVFPFVCALALDSDGIASEKCSTNSAVKHILAIASLFILKITQWNDILYIEEQWAQEIIKRSQN